MRQSRKERDSNNFAQNISPPSLSSISSAQTIRKKQESGQQEKRIKLIEYGNGIYQGMVNPNDERTNLGIYTWDSGEVYFGEWKRDMLDGEGILFFPFGGFIHGFFMKNKLNGAAFFKFQNGDIYEGFWRDGKLQGNCYKYFTDEERWILSDYKNGEFKKIVSKGDGQPPSYVFNYITSTVDIAAKHQSDTATSDGLKIEAISFNDGGQYLGLVKNNMPYSVGIFKYSDGKYDVGYYKDGNLDGLGRLNLHNGDVYDGFLSKGLFHGLGVFFQKQSSSWIYGNFENNKCTNILKKGQGQFPIEIIEKLRMDSHRKAKKFIDRLTSLDVYFAPLYNQIPVGPEKHNFYLDLSITNPANISNNGPSQGLPEAYHMKKMLPKDLTSSSYQSPPKSRSKSRGNASQNAGKTPSVSATSSAANSALKSGNKHLKKERQSSKSTGKSQPQQQQIPQIYVTQSSQGNPQNQQTEQQQQQQQALGVKKQGPKKQNVVSPQRQVRSNASGNSQQQTNPASTKKSTLKKANLNTSNSNKQRSRQSSVSKIQNEKQEIDQQSIHDYDNMVKLMTMHQEGQINISQSQGQQINYDEVFNTESSPKSQTVQAKDLKTQKSLMQIIGNEDFDEARQYPYQKSKSMATFNSKKSSQSSTYKPNATVHQVETEQQHVPSMAKSEGQGFHRDNTKTAQSSQGNQNVFTGTIKPNIFGKKAYDAQQQLLKQQREEIERNQEKIEQIENADNENEEEGSDSESSFSSYSSDKVVRKQTAPSTSGRIQIPIIKEEERLRSYSGTPANRFVDTNQKSSARDQFGGSKSYRNDQDQRDSQEAEENKQFLEAERLSRQMDRKNAPSNTESEGAAVAPHEQHHRDNDEEEEEYGHIKIKDIVNINSSQPSTNRGDQSRKGAESTPNNQFITISQKPTSNKKIDDTANKEILPESRVKDTTTPSHSSKHGQHNQQRTLQTQHSNNVKSNSILELENIRNEIANYEQIAQQSIPERRKKSKSRKDTSRENSSHPRTPQSVITPKNLPSQSPNFQQSPILTTLPNPKIDYQQEDELDLEESEHVLDSIKQIKQQMINQLNQLESKQKDISTPAASNFKYNIVPSFNIPNEENNILKEDSFNHDISPQNPIENYDSPFKRDSLYYERDNSQGRGRSTNHSRVEKSQKYYTEEEANQIAQKIEQNLVSQGGDQQPSIKQSISQMDDHELINENEMEVGDMNEQVDFVGQDYPNKREERVVRSKLESNQDMLDAQQREIQESIEQTNRINQMLDGTPQDKQDQEECQQEQQQKQQLQELRKQQTEDGEKARKPSPKHSVKGEENSSRINNKQTDLVEDNQQQQNIQQQQQQQFKRQSTAEQIQQQQQSKRLSAAEQIKIRQNESVQASKQNQQNNSAHASPHSQSPINNQQQKSEKATFSQSVIPPAPVITGQVVHVVQEVLPPTQQTTIIQKKLSENLIQSTVVTKTVQPIVTTKIISPVRSRPSSQSNSPSLKHTGSSQKIPVVIPQNQKGQQTLLPQQVVGQLYSIVGGEGQNLPVSNRIFSSSTQNKITQAVNEQLQQKNPEIFKNSTPMEFYSNIVERQNHLKELSSEELEQLEQDILTLKNMNIAEELLQIMEQNRSNVSSPQNRSNGDDITPFQSQQNSHPERKNQDEELAITATKAAQEIAAAAEKARKEYEIQQQYLQSQLALNQNNSMVTQQQQKEIEELRKQQEEFIKQHFIIQKQQSEYLESLQKQQALIIQQGEDQRKRHEDEKNRMQLEIEQLDKQKNQRILEEEERLKQLKDMQEKVRQQIEEDLKRKQLEDEDHSRRQQELFNREQEILNRLQDEQIKLSDLQNEKTRLEVQEVENKKVRELQVQMEDERRQHEIQKLEELKREADSLREDLQTSQNRTEEEKTKMHQLQLKYAQEQTKQQGILDQLTNEQLLSENLQREQDISQQQDLLHQQNKIQEQQYTLQQEQFRIQREREELEIIQKQRNEESFLIEQQRISQLAAKEQELEQQIRLQNEAFLSQQEDLQRQKQQLESQKLDLILEQENQRKKAALEDQKLKETELNLIEQIKKKQQDDESSQQREQELSTRVKQEFIASQQEELKREKQEIESQKIDMLLEQERIRAQAKEEEEKRKKAEQLLEEILKQKQIEKEQALQELQIQLDQQKLQREQEQQETKRQFQFQLREQQEQLQKEKAEVEKQRILQELYVQKQTEQEQTSLAQNNLLKQQQQLQEQHLADELKKKAEQELHEQQEQLKREKAEFEKLRIQQEFIQQQYLEKEQETKKQETLFKLKQQELEKEQHEQKQQAELQLRLQQEEIQREKASIEKQRDTLAQLERERVSREAARLMQEEEDKKKKAEQEQREASLKKVDVFTKQTDAQKESTPRLSSVDITPSYQTFSISNNLVNPINNNVLSSIPQQNNQSVIPQPETKPVDIDQLIRESRLRESLNQAAQTSLIGQVNNSPSQQATSVLNNGGRSLSTDVQVIPPYSSNLNINSSPNNKPVDIDQLIRESRLRETLNQQPAFSTQIGQPDNNSQNQVTSITKETGRSLSTDIQGIPPYSSNLNVNTSFNNKPVDIDQLIRESRLRETLNQQPAFSTQIGQPDNNSQNQETIVTKETGRSLSTDIQGIPPYSSNLNVNTSLNNKPVDIDQLIRESRLRETLNQQPVFSTQIGQPDNNSQNQVPSVIKESGRSLSTDIQGIPSYSSNLNVNTSLNNQPVDIDQLIRESRLKEILNKATPQVTEQVQVDNTSVYLPAPSSKQIKENNDHAETVKRSIMNPIKSSDFVPSQPISNNTDYNTNNNKEAPAVIDSFLQQKNVDIFNQIDKIVRSASQSTSPINVTSKVIEGEAQTRSNRFGESSSPFKMQDKADQIYNEIKARDNTNFTGVPSTSVVQPNQENTLNEQRYMSNLQSSDENRRSPITDYDQSKQIFNQITNNPSFKSNEIGNTTVTPITPNQNQTDVANNNNNNLQFNQASGIDNYTGISKSSSKSPIHSILPKKETTNTLPQQSSYLPVQQFTTTTTQPEQPASVSFNALPTINSYVPLSSYHPENLPEKESTKPAVSFEDTMKELKEKLNIPTFQNDQKVRDTSSDAFNKEKNQQIDEPVPNFDIRSSISSIKKDPFFNQPTTTFPVAQDIQQNQSWTNAASLNSSGGTAVFLGLPPPVQKPPTSSQSQQNNANSLFVSFGNERIQNPLKSSIPKPDSLTSGVATYYPTTSSQNTFTNKQQPKSSYLYQQPNSISGQNGINNKEKVSSVRSSGVAGHDIKMGIIGNQNAYPTKVSTTVLPTPGNQISSQTLIKKPSFSINTNNVAQPTSSPSLMGVEPYVPLTSASLISPRTQELNQYKLNPSSVIGNNYRLGGGEVLITQPNQNSSDKFNKRFSITSDAVEENSKPNNQDSSSKFLNTLNSSGGFIGYKKKIKIQPSPQVIKETHLPIIRNHSNSNSRDSSFFQQNNSFSQNNQNKSVTGIPIGGTSNNNVLLNNSFSHPQAVPNKVLTNNILNSSLTEDQPKRAANTSLEHHSKLQSGGILKNASPLPKITEFNSPVSQKFQSVNPSQANSMHNLNRFASPGSDTSRGSVSLTKKTNVTVVYTPGIEGGVSLVRQIQNTFIYNEPVNLNDSLNNSFNTNNPNKSLIDSQASQYLQQTMNSKDLSPVRKQIVIKKSDRINMNPLNTHQKYYERNQPIYEDTLNEGSDDEQTPTNKSHSREKKQKKRVQIAGDHPTSHEVIDEQEENMCNIY